MAELPRYQHAASGHGKAEALLIENVRTCELKSVSYRLVRIHAKSDLTSHYVFYNPERYDEESLLFDIKGLGFDPVTGTANPSASYLVGRGLGCLAEGKGELDAAAKSYRTSTEAAVEFWGGTDVVTLDIGYDLARVLREQDRNNEAEQAMNMIKLTDKFSHLNLE
jgi:hypothetical protein